MKCLSIENYAKCCYKWTVVMMNRQARRQGNLYENYGNTGSRVFKWVFLLVYNVFLLIFWLEESSTRKKVFRDYLTFSGCTLICKRRIHSCTLWNGAFSIQRIYILDTCKEDFPVPTYLLLWHLQLVNCKSRTKSCKKVHFSQSSDRYILCKVLLSSL